MKGILTKEQEQIFAQMIDDAIKAKGFLEVVDGYAAKVVVTLVDDNLLEKLPEAVKVSLSELADACIDEDVDRAEDVVSDLLNALVDVPGLDEEAEGMIFSGAIHLIAGAVKTWIASKE